MFIPVFVFLSPKKPSHRSFIKSNDFSIFPPSTYSAVAQNRIQAAQAVQPAHIDPKKRFAQLRLRKLYPPSSNIVKYSFSLQPIMNNPFSLQPILFDFNFSSSQRNFPIYVRKVTLPMASPPTRRCTSISHWRRLSVRAGANHIVYKLSQIDSQVS